MKPEDISKLYEKLDKLDEKFDRKMDKLDVRVDAIDKELAIYNEQLTFHIEGVKQARHQNDLLRDYIDMEMEKLRMDFQPVVAHVSNMKSMSDSFKSIWRVTSSIVSMASLLAGLIYGILKLKGIL